jgi:ATP-binding protein involved in chromosome partitioning
MSVFTCPHCHTSTHIFGSEGVPRECDKHNIDFLGDVPLHASICGDADRGRPTVVAEPHSSRAKAFHDIAEQLLSKLETTRSGDAGR